MYMYMHTPSPTFRLCLLWNDMIWYMYNAHWLIRISVKVCRTLIKHCPAVLYDSVKHALVTFASEEDAQTALDKYLAKPAGKFVVKKYHLNHLSKYKYASVNLLAFT